MKEGGRRGRKKKETNVSPRIRVVFAVMFARARESAPRARRGSPYFRERYDRRVADRESHFPAASRPDSSSSRRFSIPCARTPKMRLSLTLDGTRTPSARLQTTGKLSSSIAGCSLSLSLSFSLSLRLFLDV